MATALTRWDPAADFAAMRNVMDRLFDQPFVRTLRTGEDLGNSTLNLDVIENGETYVIKAAVPLAEMFGYTTDLRSMTQGRATSTMHFGHYAEVPDNIAKEIVAKVRGE